MAFIKDLSKSYQIKCYETKNANKKNHENTDFQDGQLQSDGLKMLDEKDVIKNTILFVYKGLH